MRFIKGGEKELVEKLGRNDPCPCGSGKRFQEVLLERRPFSTGPNGTIIGVEPGENAVEPSRGFFHSGAEGVERHGFVICRTCDSGRVLGWRLSLPRLRFDPALRS